MQLAAIFNYLSTTQNVIKTDAKMTPTEPEKTSKEMHFKNVIRPRGNN